MKDKFFYIIIMIIVILIISVFGVIGFIMWNELWNIETISRPENFQGISSGSEYKASNNQKSGIENIDNPFNTSDYSNKVNTNNITINKHFYNQLDSEAKTIYQAIETNKDNMKSGKYKIELGTSFSNLLNQADGEVKMRQYYQSAFDAFNYDNPEMFYINAEKMFLIMEGTSSLRGTRYNVYINSGDYSDYLSDEFSSKAQVDNAINQVRQVKNQILANRTGNTYQDIKMVHDYLVDNVEYDTSLSRPHTYSIYGALVNGVCVCEGYAEAFKYLMDGLDIPCIIVSGEGVNSQGQNESHAWNYVQLNGTWYAVDVTWDDPIVRSGGRASNDSRYKYFLKGINTINQNHYPSGQLTPGGKMFSYPTISNTDYN